MSSVFVYMKKTIGRYIIDRKGAITVVSALMMPVILGFVGLGVDTSMWITQKRELQTAADAAALAAAHEISNGFADNAEAAALKEAQNNGYTGNSITLQYGTDNEAVSASLDLPQTFLFSKVLMPDADGTISSTAAAQVTGGGVTDGDGCLLSLDPTQQGAITFSGSGSTVNANGCDIYVNSDDDNAIVANGNPLVNVQDVNIVGGISAQDEAVIVETGSINTGTTATADPYADLETPDDYVNCSNSDNGTSVSGGTVNYQPSPGSDKKVFCGGLNISGGTIDFAPGVYVIDGGDFSVSGNTTITGDNVTFILTNTTNNDNNWGNVEFNGTATINLSASEAGTDYEGILFYQDRNTPEGNGSNGTNSLLGNSSTNLDGVSYFPSRDVVVGGNNTSNSPCSIVAAKQITVQGSANIGNNCTSDSGVTSIGGSAIADIKLIHISDFTNGNYGSNQAEENG